jgi:hypothetical protein
VGEAVVFKINPHMPEIVSQPEKNQVAGTKIVSQNRFADSGLPIGVSRQLDLEF